MQSDRFGTHPQTRRPFVFAAEDSGNTTGAAKTDLAERQARAAEYIAMYLDRIEIHLDRIATACEQGTVNEQLRATLVGIEHTLRQQASRR
jgi:hypothetical protein